MNENTKRFEALLTETGRRGVGNVLAELAAASRCVAGHRWMMLVAVVAVLGGFAAQSADKENRVAQPEPFAHERRAALATDAWGGMRVDWTAVADWPTGGSPAAKAARTWIGERLRNYRREPFKGDVTDWDAMTRFYGRQFLADNDAKHIEHEWRSESNEQRDGKPDVDPGADVFLEERAQWICRRSAIIQYEDERIVSYRSGFHGFFVENSTSAAYVKCATFRKSDGKILGWDAFTDTNAVLRLVRELAKIRFKETADLYGLGIAVPDAPLFTKDGFWCFWGDYAIVAPHVYEEYNKFPSLFVPWGDPSYGNCGIKGFQSAENMLSQEARSDIGIAQPKDKGQMYRKQKTE